MINVTINVSNAANVHLEADAALAVFLANPRNCDFRLGGRELRLGNPVVIIDEGGSHYVHIDGTVLK